MELLERRETKDAYGTTVNDTLDPVATLWAKIDPITFQSQERLQRAGNELIAEATHRVTIRHRTDVSVGSVLRYRGKVLEVLAVASPGEMREALELICVEKANG